jgi:D-alanine--poly(phosphoribitol) ligase subunit 1
MAIAYGEHRLSYRELEDRARRYASIFSEVPAPRIAIALPQEPDAYAAIMGAGLAGGFHTPLNTASPPDKIRKIIRKLQPDFIVGKREYVQGLDLNSEQHKFVDPFQVEETAPLSGGGKRHSLAYVIFTSGSTGDPKGVAISRAALGNYIDWVSSLSINIEDRVSQQPNLAFDISMTDIFGALCSGACLHLLHDQRDRMYPAEFIRRNKITIWNSTPSAISLMMRANQVDAQHLSTVRMFNFCGEPLLREHLDAIYTAVPSAAVQNTYGPTEATIAVTELPLNSGDYQRFCRSSVALGEAIPGCNVHLIGGPNENEGQIVITGRQLADGYWSDEERTAAVFRPVPQLGGVLGYYTGDWAERVDGHLYFKERMDFQVKIKGFRVELDEVAAAIRDCGWPVAMVFKRGDALAAVVETVPHRVFSAKQLRTMLAAKIEAHFLPEQILEISKVPRNENDKLDRRATQAWFEDQVAFRREQGNA